MVNKVFNTLCSGGVSTETQIKITACDSSMQSFFSHQKMEKKSQLFPAWSFDKLLVQRECQFSKLK